MWETILEAVFDFLALLWTDGPRKVRIGCNIVIVAVAVAGLLLWIYWDYS
jgi:hypothetical protein